MKTIQPGAGRVGHTLRQPTASPMKTIVILTLLAAGISSLQAQFRATMINTVEGNEREYTVYSNLDMYRYEFEEGDESGVVIVKPGEDKTYILMPDRNFVHITPCDGAMSRMNDPWQSYLWYKNNGREEEEGTEEVAGYTTSVRSAYMGDKKVFTAYYAEELQFPVRIRNHISEGTHMRLENIRDWKVNLSMFGIPGDYTEVDNRMRPIIPEPPAPETWEETQAPVPYHATMKRGMKTWVPIAEGDNYKLHLENTGERPAKIIYHMYRDGEKLAWDEQGKDRYRTLRLFPGESRNLVMGWEEGQDILLEVYEGSLQVSLEKE